MNKRPTRNHGPTIPKLSVSKPTSSGHDEPSPSLKKGATFQASKSPSTSTDPVLHVPSLRHRSPTSPVDLKREVEKITSKKDTDIVSKWLDPDERMPRRAQVQNASTHHHDSDSGIGSSISAGSEQREGTEFVPFPAITDMKPTRRRKDRGPRVKTENLSRPALSKHAVEHIKEHVLDPLVHDKQFKAFHRSVRRLPLGIEKREITCLRDLEKALLAIGFERKMASLTFCERSIQYIHTAVDYIATPELCRPADRAYSQEYFTDLVGQVRRYAQIRQRETTPTQAPSAQKKESLAVRGGLSQTGRPVRLVRMRDGKAYNLENDREATPDDDTKQPSLLKRELSEQTSPEGVTRSMARPRKLAPGEVRPVVIHTCDVCKKKFPRRCDLSKHLNSHVRDYKCAVTTCKYHKTGYPTKKELDRHYNDRHADNPTVWKCKFKGCPYSTKRESNCKQHMEKQHGWVYERRRGQNKAGDGPERSDGHDGSGTDTTAAETTPSGTMGTPLSTTSPRSTPVSIPTMYSRSSPKVPPYLSPSSLDGTHSSAGSGNQQEETTLRPQIVTSTGQFVDPEQLHTPQLSVSDESMSSGMPPDPTFMPPYDFGGDGVAENRLEFPAFLPGSGSDPMLGTAAGTVEPWMLQQQPEDFTLYPSHTSGADDGDGAAAGPSVTWDGSDLSLEEALALQNQSWFAPDQSQSGGFAGWEYGMRRLGGDVDMDSQ